MAAARPPFDPAPWLKDLDVARQAFSEKYANFDWAISTRQIDLAGLFAEARERVVKSASDWEAAAAFDRLTHLLGDGHTEFRWASKSRSGGANLPPAASCEALGYDAHRAGHPLVTHLPGYQSIQGKTPEFPAGLITINGDKVGAVRIGLFDSSGTPDLCEMALNALKIDRSKPCDDACSDKIDAWTAGQMTADLQTTVERLKRAGAHTLLVDITGNGGGTEWAEAAARMLSGTPLVSERLGFVRGEHWTTIWKELGVALRDAAVKANIADKARLISLANLADSKVKMSAQLCSAGPFWNGKRPACEWLADGGYSTGLLGKATKSDLDGKPWAPLVFSPAKYPYTAGVWRGPLIVVVDSLTYSAAEEFASVLQDNHAALIMGAPTGGAGCGHTDGGTPTTLPNSHGIFELPDCARFRANGDNEVAGVQPTVLAGLRRFDGVDRQAHFLNLALPEAERLAQEVAH